jgi:hypothetical protein
MSLCRTPALTLRQRRLRGAGDKGQAESTRTRLLQECIVETEIAQKAAALSSNNIVCKDISETICYDLSYVQIPPTQIWETNDSTYSTGSIVYDTSGFLYTLGSDAQSPTNTLFSLNKVDICGNTIADASFNFNTVSNTILVWDSIDSQIMVITCVGSPAPVVIHINTYDISLTHITGYTIPLDINNNIYNIAAVCNNMGDLFICAIGGSPNNTTVFRATQGFTNVSSTLLGPAKRDGDAICDLVGNAVFTFNTNSNTTIRIISITPTLATNWSTTVNISSINNNSSIAIDTSGTLYLLYTNTGNGYPLNLARINSATGSIIGTTQINYPVQPNLQGVSNIYAAINTFNRFFYAFQLNYTLNIITYVQYGELDLSGNLIFSTTFPNTNANYVFNTFAASTKTMTLCYGITTAQFEIAYMDVSCVTVDISQCSYVYPGCACPKIAQPTVQIPTVPNQLSHILDVAVNCPLLFVTPTATYGCQPVYTEPIAPLQGVGVEKPQGPAVTSVYRKFQRIGGIDQISKPLVGRAGSDRTARLRAGIISQSQTRYVQTVLPLIPYPPCLPPSPQPGVPIAPNSGCNPGTRRVDYSNPRA